MKVSVGLKAALCCIGPNEELDTLADRHNVTPASIALAWLLSREQTIAIPKTSRIERLPAIIAALDVKLDDADLELLDDEFPAPEGPSALSIV